MEVSTLQGIQLITTAVSTFVAGVDVTAENGGTHVIPGMCRCLSHVDKSELNFAEGSHLWPQERAPRQEDTVAVEMKKGELFDYPLEVR